MKKLFKTFAIVLLLGVVQFASAATYYWQDTTGTGADPSCSTQDGNDSYNGLSRYPGKLDDGVTVNAAYGPKKSFAGFTFPSGRHDFKVAWGSALNNVPTLTPLSGTSKTARTVFTAYTHPGCVSSQPPRLNAVSALASNSLLNLNKSNYFEVSFLYIKGDCSSSAGKGITLANGRDVYVHDSRVSCFAFNLHGSDGDGSAATADFWIANNEIDHAYNLGFEGGGDRFLIEGNNFHHNGTVDGVDHNIYVGGTSVIYDNIVIRKNTLTFNQQASGSISKSVSLIAHGYVKNLLIEYNYIEDLSTGYGHYGIAVDGITGTSNPPNPQWFPGLIIRGNKIVIAGYASIGIHWTCVTDGVIENNEIVHLDTQPDEYFRGIRFDDQAVDAGRGDVVGSNSTVLNNTIHLAFNNASPPGGFTMGIDAGTLGGGGDNIINNVIYMKHAAGGTGMTAMKYNGRAAGTFGTIANNIAFSPTVTITWSDASATPPGGEPNSSIADPLFVATPNAGNSYNVALQSGSPAVNAGHATKSSRTAAGPFMAVGTRDIGAREYNASVPAPVGVSGGAAN